LSTNEWLQALASGDTPVRDNIVSSYLAAKARQSVAA
jgi:hypothetical protein